MDVFVVRADGIEVAPAWSESSAVGSREVSERSPGFPVAEATTAY